jgi:hypothetical protein
MTPPEALMIGGMVGLCAGITVGAILVHRTMIPETSMTMLQDKLRRAIGAVRTAQSNLVIKDCLGTLETAERLIEEAGVILRTDLRGGGDR